MWLVILLESKALIVLRTLLVLLDTAYTRWVFFGKVAEVTVGRELLFPFPG